MRAEWLGHAAGEGGLEGRALRVDKPDPCRAAARACAKWDLRVGHLWRDKWTALSGSLSLIVIHGLGEGICCPLRNTMKRFECFCLKDKARFWP